MMSEALWSERKSGPGSGNLEGVREIGGGRGNKKAEGRQRRSEGVLG